MVHNNKSSFSQEKWLADPANRYLIVEDMLKKNNYLKGMNKEQVVNLLGEPSTKFPSGYAISLDGRRTIIDIRNPNVFVFVLEIDKMPEYTEALYVLFDSQGNTENCSIIGFTT